MPSPDALALADSVRAMAEKLYREAPLTLRRRPNSRTWNGASRKVRTKAALAELGETYCALHIPREAVMLADRMVAEGRAQGRMAAWRHMLATSIDMDDECTAALAALMERLRLDSAQEVVRYTLRMALTAPETTPE